MEYLVEGANIYTLDDNDTVAEAMLVANGLVKEVGSPAELRSANPEAQRVELDGGAVIPAFNDTHCHIPHLGFDLARPDLRYCTSVPEIQDKLKTWAAENPEAPWIIGRCYNQNNLPGRRHVTKDELDAVSDGRPVYLIHLSGHAGLASTKALEEAEVTADTPDPEDGVFVRDESGRPTGLCLEGALYVVEDSMPQPSLEELAEALKAAADDMARVGILAASDAWTGKSFGLENELTAYALALEMGGPVRFTVMPDVDSCRAAGLMNRADFKLPRPHPELRVGAMKILADGALTPRTAAMEEPFEDADTTGILIYEPEELIDRIVAGHKGGWQVAVHGIGDRVIRIILEGFARALAETPRDDCRHRIEHAMVLNEKLLTGMAEMSIIGSAQPEFIFSNGPAYVAAIGERAQKLMPYMAWQKLGIPICFGSDRPVSTGDPILGWRAAVDRKSNDGLVLGADECLDPLTALKVYTKGGAWATFDEEIGTLEPGKQARFTYLNLQPDQILDPEMKVLGTSAELLK